MMFIMEANMKNIKLILEKDDKIQDKKIFILPNSADYRNIYTNLILGRI